MTLTREKLVEYLVGKLGARPQDLTDTAALFSRGLLDSFAMMDLITFVEAQAGITVRPTDVTLQNLDLIDRILRFAAGRPPA